MSLPYRPLLLALSALLVAGVTGLASAQAAPKHKDRGHEQGQDERSRRRSELSDSVRKIERETRGQVLSAERLQYEGRELNRVKVLDDSGRIRVYVDDPSQRRRGADARTRRDDDDEPNL